MADKRNVYPNEYIIHYSDYRGEQHTSTMRGLTAAEAICRFQARNMTAQGISARIKHVDRPKFSELFH